MRGLQLSIIQILIHSLHVQLATNASKASGSRQKIALLNMCMAVAFSVSLKSLSPYHAVSATTLMYACLFHTIYNTQHSLNVRTYIQVPIEASL